MYCSCNENSQKTFFLGSDLSGARQMRQFLDERARTRGAGATSAEGKYISAVKSHVRDSQEAGRPQACACGESQKRWMNPTSQVKRHSWNHFHECGDGAHEAQDLM